MCPQQTLSWFCFSKLLLHAHITQACATVYLMICQLLLLLATEEVCICLYLCIHSCSHSLTIQHIYTDWTVENTIQCWSRDNVQTANNTRNQIQVVLSKAVSPSVTVYLVVNENFVCLVRWMSGFQCMICSEDYQNLVF